MTETHALLNFLMTVLMAARLAPLRITRYEEPVRPENIEYLAAIRRRLDGAVRPCAGERHYTRSGFRLVPERQLCNIIMTDATGCSGPSELKRIALCLHHFLL